MQERDAGNSFILTIALMLLSMGLAGFAAIFVSRRVVSAAARHYRRHGQVVEGDLDAQIPFMERRDEIGQFAAH